MRPPHRARRLLLAVTMAGMLAAVLTACGNDGGDPEGEGTFEGDWVATEVIEHGQDRALVEGTTVRLHLDRGMLSASAGCNTMGAGYTIVDDVLRVDSMSTTDMGCDPPRHDQDQWLSAFLSSQPVIEPTPDGFVLRADATRITLVERSVVEPDQELVGTSWYVDGYIEGSGPDSSVSSAPDNGAMVLFDPNGFVAFNDGCNDFGWSGQPGAPPTDGLAYEVVGDTITYSGMASGTLKLCADVDPSRLMAVLTGTVTWTIESSGLTLVNDAGEGVLLSANP